MDCRSNRSLYFFFPLALIVLSLSVAATRRADAYLPCNGSIAECNQEQELLMESEIARRFLAQEKYISYGATRQNQPACGGGAKGEAYSKNRGCLPQPSNPPTRGCEKYYRCRNDS